MREKRLFLAPFILFLSIALSTSSANAYSLTITSTPQPKNGKPIYLYWGTGDKSVCFTATLTGEDPATESECYAAESGVNWILGPSFTISTNQMGSHTVTASADDNVYFWPTDPAWPFCPSAPQYVYGEGSVTVQVVPRLTQFTINESNFPKCKNSPIGPEDFVIGTDPHGYENLVQVSGYTTVAGSAGKLTITATATLYDQILTASYTLLGDNTTEACQELTTKHASSDQTGVRETVPHPESNRLYLVYTENTHTIATITQQLTGQAVGWSYCGGGITTKTGTSSSVTVGVTATVSGEPWVSIAPSFGLLTTKSQEISFDIAGMKGKELLARLYRTLVHMSCTITRSSVQVCCHNLGTPDTCEAATPVSDDGIKKVCETIESDGEGPGGANLCVRCCNL